jgi:hypothetical protein
MLFLSIGQSWICSSNRLLSLLLHRITLGLGNYLLLLINMLQLLQLLLVLLLRLNLLHWLLLILLCLNILLLLLIIKFNTLKTRNELHLLIFKLVYYFWENRCPIAKIRWIGTILMCKIDKRKIHESLLISISTILLYLLLLLWLDLILLRISWWNALELLLLLLLNSQLGLL